MNTAAPPLFTILLPVVRPPFLLPLAIESVLAQSVGEFELLVICDGAPWETVACAEEYALRDRRIRVFPLPKALRNGESHRHDILAGATGRYVAQIADDDLWFPDHLSELAILLAKADFGNLLQVHVQPDGRIEILPGDIGFPGTRRRMLMEPFNLFGPSVAGYRLEAYRRLPKGWAPAPSGTWSDLHMWRKFLEVESFTFATRAAVTAAVFPASVRPHLTLEQRRDENRDYLERIRDPARRNEITEAAWHSLLDRIGHTERQLAAVEVDRDPLAAKLARKTP
jgi:glycosyltransferase involved in cell wall biosynthesis